MNFCAVNKNVYKWNLEGFRNFGSRGQYDWNNAEMFNSMSFIEGEGNLRLPSVRFPVWVLHGALWLSDTSGDVSAVIPQAVGLI